METAQIKLNGQTYTIKELPSRKNQEWRKKLEQPFQELTDILANAPGVELDVANMPKLADMLKVLVHRVAGSIDLMGELLFNYCQGINDDLKKDILENGYDSELIEAFAEVLKLAYPFGRIASLFNSQTGTQSTDKPI